MKAWTTTTNNVWEAMNNMMTLQHTQIKASFETSTYVVGHVFKVILYKKLLDMVSRYALNEITAEYERVPYAGTNLSRCGCVMRTTHGLPCACELSKYVVGSIPLETIHIFWLRLSFSDQGLCEAEVTITEEMETISKRFEQLNVCGKVHLKTKLQKIVYPDLNSMCPPLEKVKNKGAPKKTTDQTTKEYVDALHSVQNSNSSVKHSASSSEQPIQRRNILMLDQFHSCIQDSIENIIDVKADGNCDYRTIAALLGIGAKSWSLVRNHLHKELTSWSEEYINLLSDIERFKELKCYLLVYGLSMVTMDKWMNITDMGYVIVSQYNVIIDSLSRQQSMTFFPLKSQPPPNSSVPRVICISHVYENHFVQVFLRDYCPLPPLALLWNTHCHYQAKQWPTPYIGRMQRYTKLSRMKTEFVELGEE
ncbi:hypothetical protein GmHk_17G049854 [Glycine max]|nr:hypothetical protein GmHk_17G049854 [Glycine max]